MNNQIILEENNIEYNITYSNYTHTLCIEATKIDNLSEIYRYRSNEHHEIMTPLAIFNILKSYKEKEKLYSNNIEFKCFDENTIIIKIGSVNIYDPSQVHEHNIVLKKETLDKNDTILKTLQMNLNKKKKSFLEKIKEPQFILNAVVGFALVGISWKIYRELHKHSYYLERSYYMLIDIKHSTNSTSIDSNYIRESLKVLRNNTYEIGVGLKRSDLKL